MYSETHISKKGAAQDMKLELLRYGTLFSRFGVPDLGVVVREGKHSPMRKMGLLKSGTGTR